MVMNETQRRISRKISSIDCEAIKNVLDERKDDIKEALYLDRKTRVFSMQFGKVISRKLLVFAWLLACCIGAQVLMKLGV